MSSTVLRLGSLRFSHSLRLQLVFASGLVVLNFTLRFGTCVGLLFDAAFGFDLLQVFVSPVPIAALCFNSSLLLRHFA